MRRWLLAAAMFVAVAVAWLAAASAAAPVARPGSSGAARARAQARDILSERRFHGHKVPAPLKPLLQTVGDAIQAVVRAVDRLVARLATHVPGGSAVLWGFLALALLGAAALAASRRVARRTPAVVGPRGQGALADRREDPRELERAADEADSRGDHSLALRLRFRAGLIRLDAADAIALTPSLTTGEVARIVALPDFDELAGTFEAVAYGGRDASADDAVRARERWPRVVEEAAGR